MSGSRRRLLRILWILALAAVIVGSILPAWTYPIRAIDQLRLSDKSLHFLAYTSLAFLPAIHENWPRLILTLSGLALLGLFLEFLQGNFGRQFDLNDMAANLLGLFFGFLLGLTLRARQAYS